MKASPARSSDPIGSGRTRSEAAVPDRKQPYPIGSGRIGDERSACTDPSVAASPFETNATRTIAGYAMDERLTA
ncbi:hypothetical protein [Natrinema halophilum]|uniref:hypothetical protein n=1 Tax=Natrinema halophilum TaxID=1699371 RepID=UPI001F1D1B04|nr:hypothetical protein [Natrinema halophilum]UHQ96061.1 hypothetical protein HYG82_20995 [Natrinema halophilum]